MPEKLPKLVKVREIGNEVRVTFDPALTTSKLDIALGILGPLAIKDMLPGQTASKTSLRGIGSLTFEKDAFGAKDEWQHRCYACLEQVAQGIGHELDPSVRAVLELEEVTTEIIPAQAVSSGGQAVRSR